MSRLLFVAILSVCLIVALSGALVADDAAMVYVIHGIPGADLGLDPALPVDVAIDGQCAIAGLVFGDIVGPVALPAGDYLVEISLASDPPCDNPAVISAVVPIIAGENATIIAHLTEGGVPTASKFVNDVSKTGPGLARVAVRHTAAAPAVDVYVARPGPMSPGIVIENLMNPEEATAEFRPGNWWVSIAPAGEMDLVFGPVQVRLSPFTGYAVYAVGSLTNETFTLITQVFPKLR